MDDRPHRCVDPAWPTLLPCITWQDTCTTLHMWTQVVGKIRLEFVRRIQSLWGRRSTQLRAA